ncbi:MAG: ligand-binding sensor domain-containing protein, partial [Glaciecola sp.]
MYFYKAMFTFRRIFCYHLFTLILFVVSVSAQQGNFKNYSVNDGLAQSQVYSISETADGFLWIGTRGGGLCKFDGLEFITFTKKDGLPSNYVNSLFQDENKHLWIGTSNGLCVFRYHIFESVKLQVSTTPIVVSAISNDHQGRLWVGTNQGLFLHKDSIFVKQALYPENIKTKFSQEVTCIIQGQDSSMWIGTNRGLVNLKNGAIRRYSTREGLRNNYVHSLSYDNIGNLWIGSYGKGISILTSDGIKQEEKLNLLNESIIHQLTTDENDNMWIATLEEGLVKWNVLDSTLNYFTESDGLANNHVRCMFEDSWSNLWIGTSGGGISKFSGQHFNEYNTASIGMKSNYVYALTAVNDSDLWISNSGLGVDRFFNNIVHHYGADSGFVNDKVKTIHRGNDNVVWFGTEGKGIYMFKDDSMQRSLLNVGSQWIKDITEDNDGMLWVATSGGGITKVSTSINGEKPLL